MNRMEMKLKKQKQKKVAAPKVKYNPARTLANKERNKQKEAERQAWFRKNRVLHGKARLMRRTWEAMERQEGQRLAWLSAEERIVETHKQPLTRQEMIEAGWIKPRVAQ